MRSRLLCAPLHTCSAPASAAEASRSQRGRVAGVSPVTVLSEAATTRSLSSRLRALRPFRLSLTLLAALPSGCVSTSAPAPVAVAPEPPRGEPLEFSFSGSEQEVVSSATTRGRVTLLVFVTTYDMASQVLLRRIGEVMVRFVPRINVAAVVMEAPRYAELLPAYRDSLQLPFPVVMTDFATQQGQGPFASIQHVPTVLVLDRMGREVARRQGLLDVEEIESELKRAGGNRRP